ncbi:unnamed protein product, partial [Tilletia laevis]
MNLPSIGFK